jgi:hypothetical protein
MFEAIRCPKALGPQIDHGEYHGNEKANQVVTKINRENMLYIDVNTFALNLSVGKMLLLLEVEFQRLGGRKIVNKTINGPRMANNCSSQPQ